MSRRGAVAILSASALAGSAATAMTAVGHQEGRDGGNRGDRSETLLETTLVPSVPSDPALHGVHAGGAPWVLRTGEAQLRRDGRLELSVRGLVIPVAPGNGTPGPVITISAALFCGTDTMAAGSTPSLPISAQGNARIEEHLSLPAKCDAPALLVQPNGSSTVYIASSGFTR